jgi:NAD-dependent dihydropyrimidine dehydrogenase PreA subunit
MLATNSFTGDTIMTMKILEDCIACGACVPECPTESISEGDGVLYVINQDTCVECVTVCPVECIVKA